MSRRSALVAFLALAAPAAGFAMSLGGDTPTRIPVPSAEFKATVEDVSGTVMEVSHVTFDGEVYLAGTVGEAQVAVPFEKIATVRVEPTNDETRRVALATLKDGTTVRVIVERDVPCYGAAVFGNYKIDVEKIRKITFH